MVHKNWTLAVLIACAILGALPILASCESDTPPGPTTDDNYPLCEGKLDGPGCPLVLPDEDASSTDTNEGSKPDTELPAPLPDCSKVTDPYPTGTWLDCGPIDGQCQIEWHHKDPWGCRASCWKEMGTPPPVIDNASPEDLALIYCPPIS